MNICKMNDYLWHQVEDAVTPLPRNSQQNRLCHLLPVVAIVPGILTGMLVASHAILSYSKNFFCPKELPNLREDFSPICHDSREWKRLGPISGKLTLGIDDPHFLLGTATCTYQDSGSFHCPDSQWADWEEKCLPEKNRSGNSANLFGLYKTPEGRSLVIDRLKKLGCNSYRFSVEWSHICDQKGGFKQEIMEIYTNLCKELRREKIRPMVTLHHFSEPKEFHKKGSFAEESNIEEFVLFSQYVFRNLTQGFEGAPLVDLFCTINEPAIEAFCRYVRGAFSPGIFMDFEKSGLFLKGALKAHQKAYEELKKISHRDERIKIGLIHQCVLFKAANPILYPVANYLTRLINDVTLNCFKTGDFELKIPFFCNVSEKGINPQADFIGLQYYARPVIGLLGSTSYHEPMTEMSSREDPEGLFEAIKEVYGACHIPIIITENGISTHDEEQRYRYMERALYAVRQARLAIGRENLIGYYLWSFCNNLEWDMGMEPQAFGAYEVKHMGNEKMIAEEPKKGVEPFIKTAQAWQTRFRG